MKTRCPEPSRRAFLAGTGSGVALAVAGCLGDSSVESWDDRTLEAGSAVQYNDPTCGCCGAYATYLDERLSGSLEVVETDDVAAEKRAVGVPAALYSCHTVLFDDLYVEGHVPVEAIEAALESSAVVGVAVPAMPANAPGMGGPTDDPLEVYGVDAEGGYDVFASV